MTHGIAGPADDGPAEVIAKWTPSEVRATVTLLDLDRPGWSSPACRAVLDPGERAAAERLATRQLSDRFVTRRAAVRHLLATQTGQTPSAVALSIGPAGKPYLRAPHERITFNVSHSRNLCVIALGADTEIGVDIEHLVERPLSPHVLEMVLGPDERAELELWPERHRTTGYYRAWTRKEAMLKATGTGLTVAPTELRVDLDAEWRLARFPARPDLRPGAFTDLSGAHPGICLALVAIPHRP